VALDLVVEEEEAASSPRQMKEPRVDLPPAVLAMRAVVVEETEAAEEAAEIARPNLQLRQQAYPETTAAAAKADLELAAVVVVDAVSMADRPFLLANTWLKYRSTAKSNRRY
jgi:hypothetical protein